MRIKSILGAAAFMLTALTLQAKPQFGQAELFNSNWSFNLSDVKEATTANFDDSKWRTLDLPHDWSVEGIYSPDKASCTGYLPGGIGWYRKTFTVPESQKDKRVYIYFEGVYNHSEVFINGIPVGKRPPAAISFFSKNFSSFMGLEIEQAGSLINHKTVSVPPTLPVLLTSTSTVSFSVFFILVDESFRSP